MRFGTCPRVCIGVDWVRVWFEDTTKGEVGVARSRSSRMGVGRRLIGWIAAYALVLQAALSGIVTTQLAATNLAAHGVEICLTDPDGAPVPAGNHAQHESCAIHCNAVASGAPAVADGNHTARYSRSSRDGDCFRRPDRALRPVAPGRPRQPRTSVSLTLPTLLTDRPRSSGRSQAFMEGTMTRRVAIFTGACALFLASPALAHHPGGASNTGGAGPIVTISASTLEAGHGAVAFLNEYLKFGGIGDTDLIAAAGKHIHAHSVGTIQSAIASAAYGVTDDLMVSVRVPYVRRTDIREGHHAHLPAAW